MGSWKVDKYAVEGEHSTDEEGDIHELVNIHTSDASLANFTVNRIFSSKSDRSLTSTFPKTSYFASDFEIEEKGRKMVGLWRDLSRTQGKCWHLEKKKIIEARYSEYRFEEEKM